MAVLHLRKHELLDFAQQLVSQNGQSDFFYETQKQNMNIPSKSQQLVVNGMLFMSTETCHFLVQHY